MASTSHAAADDRTTDSSLAGRIFGLGVHNLVKDGGSFMASLCSLIVKAALKHWDGWLEKFGRQAQSPQ